MKVNCHFCLQSVRHIDVIDYSISVAKYKQNSFEKNLKYLPAFADKYKVIVMMLKI